MTDLSFGQEAIRQDAIQRLRLHTLSDLDAVDFVTQLACKEFDVPISLVTLLTNDKQLFLSHHGISIKHTPRDWAFCNYAVGNDAPFVVEDAETDSRFSRNPLVTGAPFIRSYAGVPLEIEAGVYIGALCIIDTKARRFDPECVTALARFAGQAIGLIQNRVQHLIIQDLTEKKAGLDKALAKSAEAIAKQRKLLDDAAQLADMGAFEADLLTGELTWSPTMYRLHDVPPTFQPDRSNIRAFYSRQDWARYETLVGAAREIGDTIDFEAPMTTANGRRRWMRLRVNSEYDENGVEIRRFGMKQDVTNHRKALNRARYLAERDPLTGLRNRKFFQTHADEFLKQAAARGHNGFVLIVDLNGFKLINDTHGHRTGDICLKEAARRITRLIGRKGIVMRIGGDEFVILLTAANHQTVRRLIGALPRALEQPIAHDGRNHTLGAAIGVATAESTTSAMELMRRADLAMYAAKAQSATSAVWFDNVMKEEAITREKLLSDARSDLGTGAFTLFYQPKVALGKGTLVGFEALLRWQQPDGGYLAPGAFLPVMDDHALSAAIGVRVIDLAIAQASSWELAGRQYGHIAINLSSSQFAQEDLAETILSKLSDAEISPDRLEIEITEGVLLGRSAGQVFQTLEKMRAGGLRIALDDFGTGFASLIHLRDLPIDVIKIDQSFTRAMMESEQDRIIVQSIAQLAQRLGKTVVAEGVECALAADMMHAWGVDVAQGYYYAKPLPEDKAVFWCASDVSDNVQNAS